VLAVLFNNPNCINSFLLPRYLPSSKTSRFTESRNKNKLRSEKEKTRPIIQAYIFTPAVEIA
jgi:hypothetical protein